MKTYDKLIDMLDALKEIGRADLLIEIREPKLRPLEVYKAYHRHKLDELPKVVSTARRSPR